MVNEDKSPEQRAEEYVVELLKKHGGSVKYNEHFYRDGDGKLFAELMENFGMEDDWSGGPPCLVDEVVWSMERRGMVTTDLLPELMGDGHPDYRITATDKLTG